MPRDEQGAPAPKRRRLRYKQTVPGDRRAAKMPTVARCPGEAGEAGRPCIFSADDANEARELHSGQTRCAFCDPVALRKAGQRTRISGLAADISSIFAVSQPAAEEATRRMQRQARVRQLCGGDGTASCRFNPAHPGGPSLNRNCDRASPEGTTEDWRCVFCCAETMERTVSGTRGMKRELTRHLVALRQHNADIFEAAIWRVPEAARATVLDRVCRSCRGRTRQPDLVDDGGAREVQEYDYEFDAAVT
ncbi:MAG: hypothetical protein GY722_18890, partial [bacterium]|nr:hypothetical protein [bacterium]